MSRKAFFRVFVSFTACWSIDRKSDSKLLLTSASCKKHTKDDDKLRNFYGREKRRKNHFWTTAKNCEGWMTFKNKIRWKEFKFYLNKLKIFHKAFCKQFLNYSPPSQIMIKTSLIRIFNKIFQFSTIKLCPTSSFIFNLSIFSLAIFINS